MKEFRITVDIAMTLLSIILMGGNYLFPTDIVHEILGVALFILWVGHIILNHNFYKSIFRGKYKPYRIMQTVINCAILVCVIFLILSGIILSNHLFTFLNIQSGLAFARIVHLLASHWYYLFMSLHIGLHVGMISNKLRHSPALQDCHSPAPQDCHSRAPTRESSNKEIIGSSPIMTLVGKILLALICAYGLYAFIGRGVWKYLILQQQFFFFDLEKGYILFALDYISIIILFAKISHLIASRLKKNR